MAFDEETIDVLIGGYLSKDAAMEDYESVLGCGGYLHGAVVVTKSLEGELEVQQTDHMVRGGGGSRGCRLRRRSVRTAAARRDRRRGRPRRRVGQARPPSAGGQAGGAGRCDHPARWCRTDRGLPALRSRHRGTRGQTCHHPCGRRGRGPPRPSAQGRDRRRAGQARSVSAVTMSRRSPAQGAGGMRDADRNTRF